MKLFLKKNVSNFIVDNIGWLFVEQDIKFASLKEGDYRQLIIYKYKKSDE